MELARPLIQEGTIVWCAAFEEVLTPPAAKHSLTYAYWWIGSPGSWRLFLAIARVILAGEFHQ